MPLSTTRRCGGSLPGRRRDFAIWFWKRNSPTIHRLRKRPGFWRAKLRPAAAPSKTGTKRSNNGSCGSIGCANGCRSWHCPPSEQRTRGAMLEHICHGAFSSNEIKDRPVLPVVKSWLSRQQQAWIEEYAPERIRLPNGRIVKVVYSVDGPPTIAARIQDLYGIKEALWVASRRVPVRIQVLAPNNRPVQITENLSVFWRETYPKLKQELQRKYPKHDWR